MLKTQLLTKIDSSLKQYVDKNNTRYKRNIQSIFMDKEQLKNFYYDMQEEKKSLRIDSMPINNKNKTMSYLSLEKKTIDWRNVDKMKMNNNPLISNYNEPKIKQNRRQQFQRRKNIQNRDKKKLQIVQNRQKSGSLSVTNQCARLQQKYQLFTEELFLEFYQSSADHLKNMPKNAIQQYDKEQILKIKKIEEDKYIGKYKFKIGKKDAHAQRKTEYNAAEIAKLESVEAEQKKFRKIHGCLRKMIENYSPCNTRYGIKQIQALRQEKNKKEAIKKAIKDYFLKKNRYYPAF